MARELIKKIIDGSEYEFQQFGAKQSLKLLTRVLKIIGEPMALSVEAFEGEGKLLDRKISGKGLALAAKALTERLDQDEVVDLLTQFCSHPACLCDGKQVEFNTHYEGRLGHLFKVFQAALEVQYQDFFGALSELRDSKAPVTTPAPPM